jgi:hypothetical protein
MYPLGMEFVFMVLRIKFGPHIWKYRHPIYQRLAIMKKRHKRLLKSAPKNKVQIAITSELVTSMWYIVAMIGK